VAQRETVVNLLAPVLLTSVVGTYLTVRITRWLKRPGIRVRLAAVDARFENIFHDGYLETALADVHERDGRLEKVSNLRHFLDRYVEIELTLADAQKLSVRDVFINLRDGTSLNIGDELLMAGNRGFESAARPVLEQHVTRSLYVPQDRVPGGPSAIVRLVVRDDVGRLHKSARGVDAAELSVKTRRHPSGWTPPRRSTTVQYALNEAPSRLSFGHYVGNIGPHVGCMLQPTSGSPYQPPIDQDEADDIARLVRGLPGCDAFEATTVREGAIISNPESLTAEAFFQAPEGIHIADNGTVTVRLMGMPTTLEELFRPLLILFVLAQYLCETRFTISTQHLTFGYWIGDGVENKYLAPPGDSKYSTIEACDSDFAVQCADVVVDVLRARELAPRRLSEAEELLRAYWSSVFPINRNAALPNKLLSPKRGSSARGS